MQLLTSLNKLYSDKREQGASPLAIEEKGHLLFNKWETSLVAYKRLEAEAKQAQASNRAQYRTSNQEQGLVHGAIPIMSPPTTMTHPNQSSSANSQSSGNSNSTSHSARSHPNSRPPFLPTNAETNSGNQQPCNLQPRVEHDNRRSATRDRFFASRNTGNMEDGEGDAIIIDGPLSQISRRPALQTVNPRPQIRQRTGEIEQRSQPINSHLQFPTNGTTPLRPAHTMTEDQRARNAIDTYDSGQDVARSIFESMNTIREEMRRNSFGGRNINIPTQTHGPLGTTTSEYVTQAQAFKDLVSGFGGAQNIQNEQSRNETLEVFNSILSNIKNAANKGGGNGNRSGHGHGNGNSV